MKKQTMSTKKALIVGLLVLIPIGAITAELALYHAGANKAAAINAMKKHNPNDVRAANQTVEIMIADFDAHTRKALQYCEAHNIKGAERDAIVEPQRKAGLDAIAKVRNSGFTAPYEPNYPTLPND